MEILGKDSCPSWNDYFADFPLVVLDDIVNQTITARQLRKLNHTIHVADDGEEALAFLRMTNIWQGALSALDSSGTAQDAPLSYVLMDVKMPVMDGLTCTRKILELKRSGSITVQLPIIVVTANARDQQIEKVLESGGDSVITKSFRIPAPVSAMADLVQDNDYYAAVVAPTRCRLATSDAGDALPTSDVILLQTIAQ